MSQQVANPHKRLALAYAELGWRVHPLPPGRKKPPLTGWKELATTDPATIESWWTVCPTGNVAVATGVESGIVVIDIDGDAGDHSLLAIQDAHGPLPATVEQFTGKGRQLFFRHPGGGPIRNRVALAESIDARADGGYVVVPPSIHPNGKEYTWEASSDPTDGCELADLPAGWIELLTAEPAGDRDDQGAQRDAATIPQGQRNDALFKRAASMRAWGVRARGNRSRARHPQRQVLSSAAESFRSPPHRRKRRPVSRWSSRGDDRPD